jgi:hypothetical protein
MFGNHSGMNPLTARKQLLIAESELNRVELAADLTTLTAGVRALTGVAKSSGSIALLVATLVTGVTLFRRGKPASAEAKEARPSWLQRILKVTGLISPLWAAIHRRGTDQG